MQIYAINRTKPFTGTWFPGTYSSPQEYYDCHALALWPGRGMNSFADRFVLPTPIQNRSPKMDGKVYSELVEDNNKNGPLLEEKALADAHVRTAKQFAEYLDAKAGTADSAGGGGGSLHAVGVYTRL